MTHKGVRTPPPRRRRPARGPLAARAAALLLSLLPAAGAAGQPRPAPADGPQSALAGQVDLARLVDLCAQRLGLSVQYDPAVLRGGVTLRLGSPLSDTELWSLTNRVLASQGFTTVRMPGDRTYGVVRLADAAALAALVRAGAPGAEDEDEQQPGPPPGFGTLVLRPEHRAPREIADALRPVLSKTGASVTELGATGMLLVADLAPRLGEARRLFRELDVPGAAPVVLEIPARHLPATALAALAAQVAAKRELVSGRKLPGELLVAPGGGSLVLIAPGHAAPQWREILEQMDQREAALTRTYTPRAFSAGEVARLIEATVRPGPAGGTGAGGADDRWRLVTDELTGALIITATAAQHEAVAALLERLERSGGEERRPVRAYPVRNRDVRELLGVLQGLLDAGVLEAQTAAGGAGGAGEQGGLVAPAPALSAPDIGRTDPSGVPGVRPPSPAAGAAAAPEAATGAAGGAGGRQRPVGRAPGRGGGGGSTSGLTLTADETTSTLIAVGEARQLAQLEGLIRQLDVRQPQVMLEVLLVSLSESQALSLGVELEKQLDLPGEARATLASLFGLSQRAAGVAPVVGGTGFSGLILSPGDFSVVIRALETISGGRAVSVPRVLVNNNQQGTFSSVLQQPIARTDQTSNIVTTSFGGTADAGTIATVRPQIAAGDSLILEYAVQLSAFVGAAPAANLPPPKQANSVQSVVTIPDGYTVVLGGLELTSQSDGEARVPGIGALPVIGELFKNRTRTVSRDRFYVFIRANVLRHGGFEDLRFLTARDLRDAGVDDGWPEVAPRVIR